MTIPHKVKIGAQKKKPEKIIYGKHFLALEKIAEKFCKHDDRRFNSCLYHIILDYTDKYFISKESLKAAAKEFVNKMGDEEEVITEEEVISNFLTYLEKK